MKSINFFSNKKAVSQYLVGLILLVVVILVVIFSQAKDLSELPAQGLDTFYLKSLIEKCEMDFCNFEVCEEDDITKCDEKDKTRWITLKLYAQKCDTTTGDELEKLKCGKLYEKLSGKTSSLVSENNGEPLTDENVEKNLDLFKSHSFYLNNKNQFENYANDKGIDVNLIYALIIKEGGYMGSFESSVRFECHRFNAYKRFMIDSKKPCTLKDGESFSRVKSETDYSAFLRAWDDNSNLAFKSSSFGFAQMMGFNVLTYAKTTDEKVALDLIKKQSNQIEYFFSFLEENGFIGDIKRKSYSDIAKKYNGPMYAQNNYDSDLESIYTALS